MLHCTALSALAGPAKNLFQEYLVVFGLVRFQGHQLAHGAGRLRVFAAVELQFTQRIERRQGFFTQGELLAGAASRLCTSTSFG